MATSLASMAARRAAAFNRLGSASGSSTQAAAASLVPRRGLAGAADHHGPPKVNFWQDPMSPSKWKEEHFVLISMAGWGVVFYGTYKFFTGLKKDKPENSVQASQ